MPYAGGAIIASARKAMMMRCPEAKRDTEVEQAQDCAGYASRHTAQPREDMSESQLCGPAPNASLSA